MSCSCEHKNNRFLRIFKLVAIFLLLVYKMGFSQSGAKQFRNISTDKGLSQSTVFAIKQDALGFIWMGTQDGLNRYNSKGFKVYRPVNGDQLSLQSYYIRSLFIDHKGSLWVGGNQGVSRYDYATDSFINYKLPRTIGEWYISSMIEDNSHHMWVASTAGEVFRLESNASQFTKVNFDLSAQDIRKISYLGLWQKNIMIGTDVGLFRTTDIENKLSKINLGVAKPFVNDIYNDSFYLWVATEGNGVLRYDIRTQQVKSYLHLTNQNSLADNNVRSIEKDVEGHIWLGTFRGLSILNPTANSFENYIHQVSQPYTISQNSVRIVYQDKQKGMWLGTYYGGVDYYHKNDIKFNLLNQNTGKLSLNDEVVSAIKQDAKGNFWIGTNDKGLNYWNKNNGNISYYSANENNPNSLGSNNIKAIAFDDHGNLMLGTHNGGFNILNPATGGVQRYLHNPKDPNSISGDLVYSILKDYKGRVWVGTRSGLDQFHPESKTFSHIHLDKAGKRLISDDITYVFEDSRHRIWIGTSNGVSQFYPDNLLFASTDDGKLSEDVVNCIVEDNKNRVWLGTRSGLYLYDEAKRAFTTRGDFIKGTIYGVVPDDEGNLWISTNTGLVRFNPDNKSTESFDETDGLQNNQFNEYAFCKAKDGMLLFGGIKGLSYFYPSAIRQQRLRLNLYFTGLEVFNKNVAADDGTKILSKHINQVEELEFGPDYKQFSIFFNTFNYISANRTHYYYKLKGYEVNWQRTDDFKASYTNLRPGTYQFYVKAVGPNGEESATRSLKIVVFPPWYNSSWFYCLILMVLVVAGYIAYRIISERIKALHQLKLERVDKEKVRYINQVKMDFFTNVSHELRTPLTLILAPLEELMKKPLADKGITKKLDLMMINAKRLYNLVDQLFEFKKTEMGTRQLKVVKSDIVSFIHEVYTSFKPLSEKNNISYTYHSTAAKLSFYFDKDAMEKILFNLLSNAFKYTNTNHKISINLLIENEFVVIKISDTGVGIEKEDLSKVFDRFYQVNNREMNLGSGVGLAFTKRLVELHHGQILVESEPGKGSIFTISIPMADAYYQDDLQEESPVYELSIVPEEDGEVDDSAPWLENELKLLIVDDNKEIIAYLQDFFSQTYQVSIAFDGKMALEMLENQEFDLIISDVMMPEMNGLHFCKRVKQNINTSHIPFILLTAKTETSQQIKGLEMGADDYVTKPFSTSLLAAKITNLLRSRKRLKEYYSISKEIVPENIAFNTVDEDFLKEAIAIIELHLSDSEFSVEIFSREIGMSRSNLYLKLRAITGESVKDFIKRIRFKRAVELILSKKYTLAQIAYTCGFNTPSYFSTAFKQYYGVMPSEYLASKEHAE